jgi:hypothetical protein
VHVAGENEEDDPTSLVNSITDIERIVADDNDSTLVIENDVLLKQNRALVDVLCATRRDPESLRHRCDPFVFALFLCRNFPGSLGSDDVGAVRDFCKKYPGSSYAGFPHDTEEAMDEAVWQTALIHTFLENGDAFRCLANYIMLLPHNMVTVQYILAQLLATYFEDIAKIDSEHYDASHCNTRFRDMSAILMIIKSHKRSVCTAMHAITLPAPCRDSFCSNAELVTLNTEIDQLLLERIRESIRALSQKGVCKWSTINVRTGNIFKVTSREQHVITDGTMGQLADSIVFNFTALPTNFILMDPLRIFTVLSTAQQQQRFIETCLMQSRIVVPQVIYEWSVKNALPLMHRMLMERTIANGRTMGMDILLLRPLFTFLQTWPTNAWIVDKLIAQYMNLYVPKIYESVDDELYIEAESRELIRYIENTPEIFNTDGVLRDVFASALGKLTERIPPLLLEWALENNLITIDTEELIEASGPHGRRSQFLMRRIQSSSSKPTPAQSHIHACAALQALRVVVESCAPCTIRNNPEEFTRLSSDILTPSAIVAIATMPGKALSGISNLLWILLLCAAGNLRYRDDLLDLIYTGFRCSCWNPCQILFDLVTNLDRMTGVNLSHELSILVPFILSKPHVGEESSGSEVFRVTTRVLINLIVPGMHSGTALGHLIDTATDNEIHSFVASNISHFTIDNDARWEIKFSADVVKQFPKTAAILTSNGLACFLLQKTGSRVTFERSHERFWESFSTQMLLLDNGVIFRDLKTVDGIGVDVGGVTKNLYTTLGEHIVSEMMVLDEVTGYLRLRPDLPLMECMMLGRLFARMAFVDRQRLEINLHPEIYYAICLSLPLIADWSNEELRIHLQPAAFPEWYALVTGCGTASTDAATPIESFARCFRECNDERHPQLLAVAAGVTNVCGFLALTPQLLYNLLCGVEMSSVDVLACLEIEISYHVPDEYHGSHMNQLRIDMEKLIPEIENRGRLAELLRFWTACRRPSGKLTVIFDNNMLRKDHFVAQTCFSKLLIPNELVAYVESSTGAHERLCEATIFTLDQFLRTEAAGESFQLA